MIFVVATVTMPSCSGSTSPGGPSLVTVTVTPPQASLYLGQAQQFQATLTGSADKSITWFAGGIAGGNSTVGTISPTGLYTAPSILPPSPTITVTASSNAVPAATGSAAIALKDDIVVQISPLIATVSTGAGQAFNATVSGTGSPSTAVTWSVNSIAGGTSTLGTIASTGTDGALYTAPAVPPSPPGVTVTATSVADPSKSAGAAVTVTCSATNSISPPAANVDLTQTQTFTASFCTAAGNSIMWDVNGIAGGNATIGTIVSSGGSTSALYGAPSSVPTPKTVTIHATSGLSSASAAVTLLSNITVNVSPSSATVQVSHRSSFAASLANTSDLGVSWFVNGTLNGSATLGQICQAGSNPCVAPLGPSAASIDYLAPATVPPSDPMTLTAVSQADPSKSGSAVINVTGTSSPVSVAVMPLYAFLTPSAAAPSTLQFSVTVAGNSAAFTWSAQSAVAGQGCSGAACGSVDASGNFTAPTVAPSPNAISIVASSAADNTKFASATVAIISGVTIERILPSSVMAGSVEAFPLTVQGLNFILGGNGTGSTILLNGAPRATTCQNSTSCSTALNPSDVQSATTLTVQVKNPGNPGLLSNPVPFVIVPFDASEDVIALNFAQPTSTGKDITVVEPTTAAASPPLDVDFDGFLLNGGCEVEGTPLSVTRPLSGSTLVSICVHGNGLDPTMSYEFTGPGTGSGAAPGDIPVTASAVAGLFPNTIELDFEISSSTLPGLRTLFITSLNGDCGSATGILEVK